LDLVYSSYLPALVGGFQCHGKKKSDTAGVYETFIFAAKSAAGIAVLEKRNPRDRF
jgi:hypothetical protein